MSEKINREFVQLVDRVANSNMKKLKREVADLESYDFKIFSTIGYGEGVFVIIVTMSHPKGASVKLTIPQSEEDGSGGNVVFFKNGSKFLEDYRF